MPPPPYSNNCSHYRNFVPLIFNDSPRTLYSNLFFTNPHSLDWISIIEFPDFSQKIARQGISKNSVSYCVQPTVHYSLSPNGSVSSHANLEIFDCVTRKGKRDSVSVQRVLETFRFDWIFLCVYTDEAQKPCRPRQRSSTKNWTIIA